ncbi:MAG: porphobilinogen synthase [Thermodesulfobacteriota bacterium]
MVFPEYRPRRMRQNEIFRSLVRETTLSADHLIYPLFVQTGKNVKDEVSSMPGVFRLSVDQLGAEAKECMDLGVNNVILFGLPEKKDAMGSGAHAKDGIIQRAIRELKNKAPEMNVITDVCLCEYTDHGHCGVIIDGDVDNDSTLELLAAEALSHAQAGADIVAPSDMMDGRIAALRDILDKNGFEHIPVMSYAVKYASAYYGPFREAAESTPEFGDRRSYQMDPANRLEALREANQDVAEAADFLMVKPALAYLDVLRDLKDNFDLPLAAYNVSGEYSMVKAAAERDWIDGERVMMETLLGMKRAGADLIITYHAKEAAKVLRG